MAPLLRATALAACVTLVFAAGSAGALTLEDLDNGASISTADGQLTFENWSVTTPVPPDPNAFAGLDLSLFEVEVDVDDITLKVLETDGPLAVFGGQVGALSISFDVVAGPLTRITGVGLAFTGTAQGLGASASISEVVSGDGLVGLLQAERVAGGAQQPTDSLVFSEAQTFLHIEKLIQLDASGPGQFAAQISEFEQSFTVEPIPEPAAAALFAVGALLVGGALRQRGVSRP